MEEPTEASRTPSEAGGAQEIDEQMDRSVPLWDPETANAEEESDTVGDISISPALKFRLLKHD